MAKQITITLTERFGEKSPTFDLDTVNMEVYEVIGILEIALHMLKTKCEHKTYNLKTS